MGITFKRWNWLYNATVPKGEVRYYSRWKFDLLKPLGISEIEHNIFYHVKPESFDYVRSWLKQESLAGKKLIAFSAGTPVKKKQWDLDHYARLGDMIREKYEHKLILLWGPGEKTDAEYIQQKMRSEAILAPPTTFNQAGAFLHFVDVLITNDGGINHLAVSQLVPAVSIFGPKSTPDKWCAWHRPEYLYLKDWKFKNFRDNRFNISPEQVFEKVKQLLEQPSIKN